MNTNICIRILQIQSFYYFGLFSEQFGSIAYQVWQRRTNFNLQNEWLVYINMFDEFNREAVWFFFFQNWKNWRAAENI